VRFEEFELLSSPPWLQAPPGDAWMRALGAEKDVQLERIRQAILKWMPGRDATAPTDAVNLIGDERLLPRITGETDAAYAERLRTAWDTWVAAGTYPGLLRALVRAGFPHGNGTSTGGHIVQRTQRYGWVDGSDVIHFGIHPSPNNHSPWTFDDRGPEAFNQFGILFAADVVDPTDGSTPLAAGTPGAVILNDLVRLWKPSKGRFMGTWIIVSGPTWGWPVDAKWGDGGRVWGVGSTRFIPPR